MLLSAMRQPGGKRSVEENGCMYMHGWSWNCHNIVNQLCSNTKEEEKIICKLSYQKYKKGGLTGNRFCWWLNYYQISQMIKSPPAMHVTQVWPLGQEEPLGKEWLPTAAVLLIESHWQSTHVAWWAIVHGVAKSWTGLSDKAHTHTHTHRLLAA